MYDIRVRQNLHIYLLAGITQLIFGISDLISQRQIKWFRAATRAIKHAWSVSAYWLETCCQLCGGGETLGNHNIGEFTGMAVAWSLRLHSKVVLLQRVCVSNEYGLQNFGCTSSCLSKGYPGKGTSSAYNSSTLCMAEAGRGLRNCRQRAGLISVF